MSAHPALVVFDLGGTTIHDRGEVPEAFAAALQASGLAVDPAAIASWRGASKREILKKLVAEQRPALPAEDRSRLALAAFDRFSQTLTGRLRGTSSLAIPEALPALLRLRGAGIRIALNSGFDRKVLDVILSAVPWPPDLFDAVVCGDDVPEGRPAPLMIFRAMEKTGVSDPNRIAVVGDTRLDLEAGANAGATYRIGVLTGAHDHPTLMRAPHTHIVDSVGSVPDIWLEG